MLMISSQELRYQFKKSDCRPQKVSYNRRNIFNKIVNFVKKSDYPQKKNTEMNILVR